MKLTTFIMIIALAQVSAKGLAQKITLNVSNTPIEKVLQSIRQQSGYEFIYNVNDLKGQKISLNIRNVSVEDAVAASIKNLDLDYKIREQNIVLTKKEKGFLDNIIARFQSIDVRGKVVDSLGNGLAGATVSVKGGKGSTSTDNNGEFYLKGVDEGGVLVVSYLGYVTKEQNVNKDFNLVLLTQSTSVLDVVQIQAYGVTSKRFNTGNITTIKGDELANRPINNPLLALQGRVPNLVISTPNGNPGAAVTLQLRGQNSLAGFSAKSAPLIVIDGVPFQNNISAAPLGTLGNIGDSFSALNFINSNDIESIDVLADADATAIYGSQGGNGVILITTKKGKSGPTEINASFNSGFSKVPSNRKIDLLNTQQYLEMRKEAYTNDGLPIPNSLSFKDESNFDLTLWDQNKYTDWQDKLIGGHAGWQASNVNISGGNTTFKYILNGNYRREGYVYPINLKLADPADNINGNAHLSLTSSSLNGKLSTTLSVSYAIAKSNSSITDFTRLALNMAPNAPDLYKTNGELNWEPNPDSPTGLGSWRNPLAELQRIDEAETSTIVTAFDLSYKLTSDLILKATATMSGVNRKDVSLTPLSSFDPADVFASGSSGFSLINSKSYTIDPQVLYKRKIGAGFLSSLTGVTIRRLFNNAETTRALGFTDDALLRNYSSALDWYVFNNSSDYRYFGLFGQFNYLLHNKYIANINLRRDGSSRFGPGRQYGNFWSIGTAWIFSEESFLKQNVPFLSFGKLRVTYGKSGSDQIGDYGFISRYGIARNEPDTYQGIRTIKIKGVNNPNFAWEDVRKGEIGLDLGFFKDRLVGSAAYWRNRSSNQLSSLELPATTGTNGVQAEFYVNQPAKIQNSGWDFAITAQTIKNRNFSWTLSANFGLQKNKLLSLPESFISYQYLNNYKATGEDPVGKPFSGLRWLNIYTGVDPTTGLYTFSDQNGNPTSTFGEIYSGVMRKFKTDPTTIGIVNTISLGNLTFSAHIQLVKQLGRNFLYSNAFSTPGRFNSIQGSGGFGNQPVEVLARWRTSGDTAPIQKFTSSFSDAHFLYDNFMSFSDAGYVDASYIRMNNASLSYKLPERWVKKLKIRNVDLQLSAENLFTITNYKYADPVTQRVDALPTLTRIIAGISLGF